MDEARRRARAPALVTQSYKLEYGASVAWALRRAIAALPDAQRAVFVLKLLEGRSFREIAARVGATEVACKMRFSRALERLRHQLEQEGVGA